MVSKLSEKKLVPNNELVAIIADEIPEKEGVLYKSEEERRNEQKKQNRGVVQSIGGDCIFVNEGDYVSFYRNAATEIEEGGKKFLIINEAHILCKLETK